MTRIDGKMFALFILMMAVFTLLGVRSEVNARDIKQNAVKIEQARAEATYESCLNSVVILTKFNTAQQALADQERDSIEEDPKDTLGLNSRRRDRIDIYETSLLPLPDCDKLKP